MVSHITEADHYRPRYHFAAPQGWLNDPNGLIQHRGVYHLFYQHNPSGSSWGNIHWGHATSADLVHWTHQPIALAPGPGREDAGGVFSGCCVIADDGTPTLIYTGADGVNHNVQAACVAHGSSDLMQWTKSPRNPIIAAPRDDTLGFRDHTVWRERDGWHMLIGSGLRGIGGCVLHYRSPDLVDWRYLGVALQGGLDQGVMWECPDFFELSGHGGGPSRHVLLVSPIPRVHCEYYTGDWDGATLAPETRGILDYGTGMWAPQSFTDARGRRIVIGWMTEQRPYREQDASPWNGCMTLPRVLSLTDKGALASTPAPELTVLRRTGMQRGETTVTARSAGLLDVEGRHLEIEVEFEPQDAWRCGISVLRSPDGEEHTDIVFDNVHQTLTLDTGESRRGGFRARALGAPLTLSPGERLRLRVFVDGSVVEAFANDRFAFSGRAYPLGEDSTRVALFSVGGAARAEMTAWEMG